MVWSRLIDKADGNRHIPALLKGLRYFSMAALITGCAGAFIMPFFLSSSSAAAAFLLPLAFICAIVIDLRSNSTATAKRYYYTLAVISALLYISYCVYLAPMEFGKINAEPLVKAVEKAAGNRDIALYMIEKDSEGLRFSYWQSAGTSVAFLNTPEQLEDYGQTQGGAVIVAPAKCEPDLLTLFKSEVRPLFTGNLGKLRCTVLNYERPRTNRHK
jgi:hypothetical protein